VPAEAEDPNMRDREETSLRFGVKEARDVVTRGENEREIFCNWSSPAFHARGRKLNPRTRAETLFSRIAREFAREGQRRNYINASLRSYAHFSQKRREREKEKKRGTKRKRKETSAASPRYASQSQRSAGLCGGCSLKVSSLGAT